jgi:hypothetical protein
MATIGAGARRPARHDGGFYRYPGEHTDIHLSTDPDTEELRPAGGDDAVAYPAADRDAGSNIAAPRAHCNADTTAVLHVYALADRRFIDAPLPHVDAHRHAYSHPHANRDADRDPDANRDTRTHTHTHVDADRDRERDTNCYSHLAALSEVDHWPACPTGGLQLDRH